MAINIEFFPAEKSCEQGCKICPMALKNKSLVETEIDANVVVSFALLEKLFKRCNTSYNLHATSKLSLYPEVQFPELIYMARFETNKDIRIGDNVVLFSDNLRELLEKESTRPKIIGLSIVPSHPLITEGDLVIVRRMIEEIGSWYFSQETENSIEITIRSNLVSEDLFHEFSSQLFQNDKLLLKEVMHGAKLTKWSRRNPQWEDEDSHVYLNVYEGLFGKNTLRVTNRVISQKVSTQTKEEFYIKQAMMFIPRDTQSMSIAVAPQGVMFGHSSLNINNPILWISHEDFVANFLELESYDLYGLLKKIQGILLENIAMYKMALKEEDGSFLQNIKKVFFNNRDQLRN